MNPSQKLDTVLNYLNENSDKELFVIKHYVFEKSNIKFTDFEMINILNRLIKDGFVKVSDTPLNGTPTEGKLFYSITFDGECLLEISKGYQGKKEAVRIENDKQILREQLLRLYALLGAIGAFGILVWEIWKYCKEHHILCC